MVNKKFKSLAMIPEKCHLWQQVTPDPQLETIKVYSRDSFSSMADDSSRSLRKCLDCGQLYFYEMAEMIDFDDGEDSIYRTYIPIAFTENADTLATVPEFDLLECVPRISYSWPKGEKSSTVWIKGSKLEEE